jgi:hypothetical protein
VSEIAVTVASDQVPLVGGRSSVTASVTNGGTSPERVVLGAFRPVTVPGGPPAGDPGWAGVDRALRDVAPGATEQFVVAVTVPPTVPAGTYELKLIAHPADAAPEEYADRGRVLRLVVPPPPPTPRPRRPWWIWAIAGALLLAVVAVAVVLLRPAGSVSVPGVVGLPQADAVAQLEAAGLAADVDARLGPRPFGAVTRQVPQEGSRLAPGSDVALTVSRGLPLDGLQGLGIENALALVAARVDEDVTGLAVAEAQETLAEKVTVDVQYQIAGPPAGRVLAAAAPDSGDGQVAQGERLVLVVATTIDLGVLDDLIVRPDLDILDRLLGG